MKTKFICYVFNMLLPLVVISFLLPGMDIMAQEKSNPVEIYEYMWKSLDVNYALFEAKHIDWKALYNINRPKVNENTSDEELFSIISSTIGPLNDNHVRITANNLGKYFGTGFLFDYYGGSRFDEFRSIMRIRPVPVKYFKEPLKESENKVFASAWLNDEIGYFHFNGFTDAGGSEKAIDEIIEKFKDAKALIVDVRRNGGGDDQIGKMLANRFADRKRLYMTTQDRNGREYNNFDPIKYFFVEPKAPIQFTKTVILLTNRLSVSAAENFTLAMRILPHVTVVGDFTSGCFADNYHIQLPNGWDISLSKNLFLDYNGFCWEGIGVPPDIKIKDNIDIKSPERDILLETAISLIQSGNLSLQDVSEGTDVTESLVDILAKEIEEVGIEKAILNFDRRRTDENTGNYYIDYFSLLTLLQNLFDIGKVMEGEKIFSLTIKLFSDVPSAYDQLAYAYFKQGMKNETVIALEQVINLRSNTVTQYSREFDDYFSDMLILELLKGNYDKMGQKYSSLKSLYPYRVNEMLLNRLGYQFLSGNLTEYSIQIFKLNVEKYPESSNVYDSLGEAYLKDGQIDLAIRNYEKSLRLDPNNTNAKQVLERLKGEK